MRKVLSRFVTAALTAAVFIMAPLGNRAQAMDIVISTNGSVYASSKANYAGLDAYYRHPSSYVVKQVRIKYKGRPYAASPTTSRDQIAVAYTTPSNSSYRYYATYPSTPYEQIQTINFDANSIQAVSVRVSVLNGGGGDTTQTAYADLYEVTVDSAPFTPSPLTLNSSPTGVNPYQVRMDWGSGTAPQSNPNSTVYEVWRKTYDGSGSVTKDEPIYSGTATTFTTADQSPGKYYSYRVRATAGGNYSNFTQEVPYWVAPTPTVTIGPGAVTLSWPTIYPSLRYYVGYALAGNTSPSYTTLAQGLTTYTYTTLSPQSQYNFYLLPYTLPNGGRQWPVTDSGTYAPLEQAAQTTAVTNIRADALTLNWRRDDVNISSNAKVRVQRNGATAFENTVTYPYTTINGVTGYWGSYTDSGLGTGQTYTYTLCFLNALNQCGPSTTITARPVPAAPQTPTFANTTTGVNTYNQVINWTDTLNPPGATYQLRRRTLDASGGVVKDELIYSGPNKSFTTTDQTPGKYYKYRVAAVFSNVVGLDSAETYYWNPPDTITVAKNTARGLVVNWPAVGNGVRYDLYYRQTTGSSVSPWQLLVNSTAATSYTHSYLDPNSTYEYALEQDVAPNAGPMWRTYPAGIFSPDWYVPAAPFATGTTQTSTTVNWSYGSNPSTGVTYRLVRGAETIYEGTARSFTDANLVPGTSFTYTICAINALDACGPSVSTTVLTIPLAPSAPNVEYGSYEWKPTSNGWAVLSWPLVQGATSYKVYYTGSNTPVITTTNGASFPSLSGATGYTFQVVASNSTGDSAKSNSTTIQTPDRSDSGVPTGTVAINEGSAVSGGSRVQVTAVGQDVESGTSYVELSNDQRTWSSKYSLQDFGSVNLISSTGGDAFFTSLAGWTAPNGIWATTESTPEAQRGGQVGRLVWTGDTATARTGLTLAKPYAVVGDKQYTVSIRYQVQAMSAGSVGIWSSWQNTAGIVAGDASVVLGNNSLSGRGWQTKTVVLTANSAAALQSLSIGFDRANTGATVLVDWIMVNEGNIAAAPNNALANPASVVVDWTLDTATFGDKYVYARFTDAAGNRTTATISDKIAFLMTDTLAPKVEMQVNGGSSITTSNVVQLSIQATDDQTSQSMLQMRVSNDGINWSPAAWEAYQPTKDWNLGASTGRKRVWVQVRDTANNIGGTTVEIFYQTASDPIVGSNVLTSLTGAPGTYDGTTVQFVRSNTVTLKWDRTQTAAQMVRFGFDMQNYGAWEGISDTRRFVLPQAQGIITLYAQADNGAVYAINFLQDTSAPMIKLAWKGNATVSEVGGFATISLSPTDNLAAKGDLRVSVTGANVRNFTVNNVSYVPNANPANQTYARFGAEIRVSLSGSGSSTITVDVLDPAGNVVTENLIIYVLQ